MAKARMLHKVISTSLDIDKLPLPARLLFTWMIAHADDDGKMIGNPRFVKATVVPLAKMSSKKIQLYLERMKTLGLIFWWSENNEQYIQFPKWKKYQTIKTDRYKTSDLPSFSSQNGSRMDPHVIQNGSNLDPQVNRSESNRIESNRIESNISEDKKTEIADKSHEFAKTSSVLDPNRFQPSNAAETAAKETWAALEPNNKSAFFTTYLPAARKGLPPHMFYTFISEIEQSDTYNPGAVFNVKVKEYFAHKEYT